MTSAADRNAWTEPAVEQVAPGVHRIPLPLPNDGLRAVNVYALVGADAVVLVDAGWSIPEARELLVAGLATLGADPADVRRCLVTHVHRDHYTQAVTWRRDFGSTVSLGSGEHDNLAATMSSARAPLEEPLAALRALGASELADVIAAYMQGRHATTDWELPDEWLGAGPLTTETGRRLEVVETPGHTRGHVVFHDEAASLLFAGDHVLPTITPSIGFEPAISPDPLGSFLASLALVRARPDAVLLPAHGPVAPSVHARIDELVAHHGQRLDETEAAVLAGADTGLEVARRLGWTRRLRRYDDLDPFNQMLAVGETGAHLTLLVAQGRVKESPAGVPDGTSPGTTVRRFTT